jgi:glucan 1,3-beta-glucosidase
VSSSEATGSGSSQAPLSAAALAKLNRANTAQPPTGGGGRRERTRERDGGGGGDGDGERERERELRRERERDLEREARRERRRETDRERERARQAERSRGYEVVDVAPEVGGRQRDRERGRGGGGGGEARRRVVSGPVLEEGGGGGGGNGWTGLRGGWRGSASNDSVVREKEGLWRGKKRPWYKQKKKLCECFVVGSVRGERLG